MHRGDTLVEGLRLGWCHEQGDIPINYRGWRPRTAICLYKTGGQLYMQCNQNRYNSVFIYGMRIATGAMETTVELAGHSCHLYLIVTPTGLHPYLVYMYFATEYNIHLIIP